MQSIGEHKNHLRWVHKILTNPKAYCAHSVKVAKEVAQERGIEVKEVA